MFSLHWFKHWDKIFWVLFLLMGISVVAGLAASLVTFEFFLVLGFFMVIIGAGKLADEISGQKLVNHQDDIYKKLQQFAQHLETTFNLVDSQKTRTEFRMHKMGLKASEIERNAERNYRDIVRKVIEVENKMSRLSKVIIEREKIRFREKEASFSEKVLSLVKQIPRGKVTTYLEIAKTAGSPKSSKAIGKVLSSNAHLKSIPFHRVVKSNGRMGSSSAEKKRSAILIREGVKIEMGRINLDRHMFSFIPKI